MKLSYKARVSVNFNFFRPTISEKILFDVFFWKIKYMREFLRSSTFQTSRKWLQVVLDPDANSTARCEKSNRTFSALWPRSYTTGAMGGGGQRRNTSFFLMTLLWELIAPSSPFWTRLTKFCMVMSTIYASLVKIYDMFFSSILTDLSQRWDHFLKA